MRSALIGFTGFVGGNLDRQYNFTDKYNSKNINEIDGQEFDLVVCAAARAEKWRINQEPEVDKAQLDELKAHLKTIKTKLFVLISTVDVYKRPVDVDEDTSIDLEDLHPYGKHRYELEQFCRQQFPNCLIMRLPGLFGPGLKKNVIFDLLHDNNIEKIHHAGTFQYYNVGHIWQDIQTALENHLTLVNITSEPIRTDEIAKLAFDMEFTNEPEGVNPGLYDFTSKYADKYGGSNGYTFSKEKVLQEIKDFVDAEKAAA